VRAGAFVGCKRLIYNHIFTNLGGWGLSLVNLIGSDWILRGTHRWSLLSMRFRSNSG
jgi:hypothetical protein